MDISEIIRLVLGALTDARVILTAVVFVLVIQFVEFITSYRKKPPKPKAAKKAKKPAPAKKEEPKPEAEGEESAAE